MSERAAVVDEQAEDAKRSPFAAVRGLAGLTMVSRVLGFARDVIMATLLGTGLAADAFFLAWMIPNLFRRLFGEGAFAAALVPVFVEAREQGDHAAAHRLVSATACRLGLGLTVLVLALELIGAAVLSEGGRAWVLELGLSEAGLVKLGQALAIGQILLPYLVFICLAGVLGGALNALDRFTVPAAAPVVLNVVWIAALVVGAQLFESDYGRVRFLAWALIVGGAAQLLMHTRAMKGAGVPVEPVLRADPERARRVRGLFLSLALGLALFQLNALLDSLIAYTLVEEEGGVSALYYANRLVQLPIGVFGVALATAIFPELARRVKQGDTAGLGEIVDRGLTVGAFIALPACAGLVVLAAPIVETLFERGEFVARSSERTAAVLLFLAPAVVTACITPVITRAFYAEEEVKTPVRVGAVCVFLNLFLNLLLVVPLQEAGLALATAISQGANLVIQAWLYRRRRQQRGDPPRTARTVRKTLTFLAMALPMAAAAWAVHAFLPGPGLVRVGAAIAVGVVVYGGAAYLLQVEELRLLLARRRPKVS